MMTRVYAPRNPRHSKYCTWTYDWSLDNQSNCVLDIETSCGCEPSLTTLDEAMEDFTNCPYCGKPLQILSADENPDAGIPKYCGIRLHNTR